MTLKWSLPFLTPLLVRLLATLTPIVLLLVSRGAFVRLPMVTTLAKTINRTNTVVKTVPFRPASPMLTLKAK